MPVATTSPVLATLTVASVPAVLLFLLNVKSIVFCAIAPNVRSTAAIESKVFFIKLNFALMSTFFNYAKVSIKKGITPPI